MGSALGLVGWPIEMEADPAGVRIDRLYCDRYIPVEGFPDEVHLKFPVVVDVFHLVDVELFVGLEDVHEVKEFASFLLEVHGAFLRLRGLWGCDVPACFGQAAGNLFVGAVDAGLGGGVGAWESVDVHTVNVTR